MTLKEMYDSNPIFKGLVDRMNTGKNVILAIDGDFPVLGKRIEYNGGVKPTKCPICGADLEDWAPAPFTLKKCTQDWCGKIIKFEQVGVIYSYNVED